MPTIPQPPLNPLEASARTLCALEQRLRRLYSLRDLTLTLPSGPRPYTIALPADPDAPLDRLSALPPGTSLPGQPLPAEMANVLEESAGAQARRAVAAGTHMPYWGLLWPSGLALAEALFASPALAQGKRALELGCGLGATAIAAIARGMQLWAADCFAEALLFTRYNTLRNTGQTPRTLLLDWRSSLGRAACLERSPFDVLLAADVLYEEEDQVPLLELAPRLLAPDGVFWLAQPGRRVSRAFVAAAHERGWQDDELEYERAWPPDGDTVRVTVHRLMPPRSF